MRAWLAAHWIGAAGYVLCVSLAAFLLMGADKRRARRGVPHRAFNPGNREAAALMCLTPPVH